jgi:hypothetical protein
MQQQTASAAKPAAKPSRMVIGSVTRGKVAKPYRIVLYGEAGAGKSTFGSEAPAPVFIGAEDGTSHLDVARFPAPSTWTEVLEAVRALESQPHEFETVVFDTLDWMEPLLWRHICERDGKASIEEYGYGKGYVAALDEWRVFVAAIERVYQSRKMNVIMLAHSWVKPFKNPEGPDFDRYQMKLDPKAAALIREWSDATLFARFETYASKSKDTPRAKGVSTGARIIHTVQSAAYDAKNRYGLPESMPLDWATFHEAARSGAPADAAALRAEIEKKLAAVPEKHLAKAREALGRAGEDVEKLSKLNVWCNAFQAGEPAAKEA